MMGIRVASNLIKLIFNRGVKNMEFKQIEEVQANINKLIVARKESLKIGANLMKEVRKTCKKK
jgi:hypothetical protein